MANVIPVKAKYDVGGNAIALAELEAGDKIPAEYLGGSPTLEDAVFDSIQLTGGTGEQGTFRWNADEETVDLVQDGTVLQLGQELQVHCRNNSASAMTSGMAVMAVGTLGASGRILVTPMDASVPANAKMFIGIVTEAIAAGTDGKVTVFGKVRGFDTSAWADGSVLWCDQSTPGALTAVKPSTGVALPVAFVVHSHATQGTLMVRTTNTSENIAISDIIGLTSALAGKVDTTDPRLSDARPASDVSAWAKEPIKPSYTKAEVGLGNVNNTSDADKPVSTLQAAALAGKADLIGGLVPSYQLPSYVDDVLEVANFAALPATGESGKIYVTLSDNNSWRWTGSTYQKVSQPLDEMPQAVAEAGTSETLYAATARRLRQSAAAWWLTISEINAKTIGLASAAAGKFTTLWATGQIRSDASFTATAGTPVYFGNAEDASVAEISSPSPTVLKLKTAYLDAFTASAVAGNTSHTVLNIDTAPAANSLMFRQSGELGAILGSEASIFGASPDNYGTFIYEGDEYFIAVGAAKRLRVLSNGIDVIGKLTTSNVKEDGNGNLAVGAGVPKSWTVGKAIDVGLAGAFFGDGINASWSAGIAQNAYASAYPGTWSYKVTGIGASRYQCNDNLHQWFSAPAGVANEPVPFNLDMALQGGKLLIGNLAQPLGGVNLSVANGVQVNHYTLGGGFTALAKAGGGVDLYNYTGIVGAEAYTFSASLSDVAFSKFGGYANQNPNPGSETSYAGAAYEWSANNAGYQGYLWRAQAMQPTGAYVNYADLVFSNPVTGEVLRIKPVGLAVTGVITTNGLKEDAAGNLALGIAPSAWVGFKAYQVIGGAIASGTGLYNNLLVASNAYYNGSGYTYIGNEPATLYRQLTGTHAWYAAPSGNTGDPVSFTQAMTLDAAGVLTIASLPANDFPNDAAAAADGIPIGGLYHTSGTVKVRLT